MKKIIVTILLCLCVAGPAQAHVVKAPRGFYPHMGVVTKCKKVKNILHNKTITETRFTHDEDVIAEDEEGIEVDYINRIHIWYK